MTDETRTCIIPGCRGGGRTETGEPIPATAGDGIVACDWHYHRYSEAIAQLVDLYALLPELLYPTLVPVSDGPRSKNTDPPAPLRLDVAVLLDPRTDHDDDAVSVAAALELLCSAIRARRGMTTAAGETVTQMQRFLRANAVWCAGQDWFPHCYEVVTDVVTAMRHVTGSRTDPHGRCHLPTRTADKCGGPVYWTSINGEDGLQCRKCRATWVSAQDLARFDLAQDTSA